MRSTQYLKNVDSIRGKIKNLESFGTNWFNECGWRNKSSYRKRHKRLINKGFRNLLKNQLVKDLNNEE